MTETTAIPAIDSRTPADDGGSVCAVVVTFNRKALLAEGLRGLLRQTRAPEKIVVVDNASTDGTAAMLAEEFPQLEVLRLAENSGGAGGFHAGIRWAYERGYDWMWVMDDDVEAVPDALEIMLAYRGVSKFIHSRRTFEGKPVAWEGAWDLSLLERRCFPEDVSFANGREWISVNSGCFEGALIHREIVDRIGLPDPAFFIAGDDSTYGYLASLHANVIYVNRVGFVRKLAYKGLDEKKLYLKFRNRFLIYKHLANAGVPLSRSDFWVYNLLAASWFVRQPGFAFFSSVKWIAAGFRDGMRGRFGRPAWL